MLRSILSLVRFLKSLARLKFVVSSVFTHSLHTKKLTMFRRLALTCAALLSVVSGQLTITSPGANDWWGEYPGSQMSQC